MVRLLVCRQPHWLWVKRLRSQALAVLMRPSLVANSLLRSRLAVELCTRLSMATSARLPPSTFLWVPVPSHGMVSTAQLLQARSQLAPRSRWQGRCLHLWLVQPSLSKEVAPMVMTFYAWASTQSQPQRMSWLSQLRRNSCREAPSS